MFTFLSLPAAEPALNDLAYALPNDTTDTEVAALQADIQSANKLIDAKIRSIEQKMDKMARTTQKELKERIAWLEGWKKNLSYRAEQLDQSEASEWEGFRQETRAAIDRFNRTWKQTFDEG